MLPSQCNLDDLSLKNYSWANKKFQLPYKLTEAHQNLSILLIGDSNDRYMLYKTCKFWKSKVQQTNFPCKFRPGHDFDCGRCKIIQNGLEFDLANYFIGDSI